MPLEKIQTKYLILLFLLSNTLIGQINNKIKGHWGGCNEEYGYTELIITDTIMYHREIMSGILSHVPYKYEKDYAVTVYSDTLFFEDISENKITVRHFDNESTFYLLNKLTPFENPNVYCEKEMTPRQFNEYLELQFYERALKHKHKCISKSDIESTFNAKLISSNDINGFLFQDDFESVYSENIEFEYIEKNIDNYQSPILFEFKENHDNNKILLIVDYWGKCYDNFNVTFEIVDKDSVNMKIKQTDFSCDKKCKVRLYINGGTKNYDIKSINIIDENR